MGKGKYYNADLDYQMKVKEFQVEWESAIAVRGEDKDTLFDLDDVDGSIL
jgi:hypothetical protein